ncbi:glycine betaine/proline transport system ATP-binding protein [Desulfotomaculum arcticum]|uniref:Quaternary amine transport ATP-binding protein n=1 Tax=Desulfotruncus arcticus DSM 17038 TaxID=1121424 RepID=A0A1I2RFA2_9FIRM|nr:glycine betaine/L-proline ABC transporter ATP-binding protein [Desulfotruncus arcticus]SFG37297.1 glycine betaine/proline transport system ATP-binding protein [Desulfotomaculum arcticum] [Desulfotruncus arcticus DSM 17038]
MIKVQAEHLIKIFGDNPNRALKMLQDGKSKEEIFAATKTTVGVYDVSFEINEGETFVLMGLSGSGKSTLLRCLNRLIEPTSGKVLIDDRDITEMDENQLRETRRSKLGMVFQRFALFPHRTVLDNVAFGLEIQGLEKEARLEKARKTLEVVGLKEWESSLPAQLSGGMQQRVGLARALASDPDILLMDEAFSALDPLIRKGMQDELLSLQATLNKTIIFVTHDLDEALKIGDRIALMKDGAIIQVGTPEEILTNPANDYVEKFVEDVDISKILTAEGVMKKADAVVSLKDGPRLAMRRMKENGISSIFVVTRDRKLTGLVLAEDALTAIEEHKENLDDIIIKDTPRVLPDTPLVDLIPLVADSRYPIAVVNENNTLLGVIVRGSVLAGMVRKGDNGQIVA